LESSGVAQSLRAIGIIDRDYHNDAYLNGLPVGVTPLSVHEAESLLALPAVVQAVAEHTGRRLIFRLIAGGCGTQ
jgi:hypothetical protein